MLRIPSAFNIILKDYIKETAELTVFLQCALKVPLLSVFDIQTK